MIGELAAGLVIGGALGAGGVLFLDRRRGARHSANNPWPADSGDRDDQRAHRLLAAVPFAALLVDGRGNLLFANPAAEALFEFESSRVIGHALIAAVPSVAIERQVLAAIRGERSTRDVTIGDGTRERTIGVTAQGFDDGALMVAVDRTAILMTESVRREFVANVSHELRTPLSAIKLMLETVLLSDDDPEARTLFLPQISHEVERMIRLIEDLLELARSESGTLLLRREIFDLTDVATAVVNTFAQRSESAQIELELEAPEPVYVDADQHRLTQVALNLVDNALRHTPPGGTVTVEVGRESEAAVLRVRDTGRGIPYHDLPHIFERFYVVDRSRSREHTGTGLGLSIARHLVEAHGGTLTAHSVFGRGATFVCGLPAVPQPPAAAAPGDAKIKVS